MLIVGLDGLVRAGKTTLIQRLGARRGWGIIEEYGAYLQQSDQAFPSFPPRTREQAIDASRLFMEIERRRLENLRTLFATHEIVLIDRTFHSCLAFDYAARKWSGLDTFDQVTAEWRDADPIIANIGLFLDVSFMVLKEQIAPHKTKYLSHFYDEQFNNYMRAYFLTQVRDATLKRIDADQPAAIVEQAVESFIDNHR